jgi:hypothetical protein
MDMVRRFLRLRLTHRDAVYLHLQPTIMGNLDTFLPASMALPIRMQLQQHGRLPRIMVLTLLIHMLLKRLRLRLLDRRAERRALAPILGTFYLGCRLGAARLFPSQTVIAFFVGSEPLAFVFSIS